ncbi:unnamed protein product [Owenia fusiformis]|uniref:Sodium channel protein n=1 Tax=Owenia fusiformis TaxID=6347 RepID=A0A8J1U284_OWEFU|nr:unnamed protein product [Owenia fusiformis]
MSKRLGIVSHGVSKYRDDDSHSRHSELSDIVDKADEERGKDATEKTSIKSLENSPDDGTTITVPQTADAVNEDKDADVDATVSNDTGHASGSRGDLEEIPNEENDDDKEDDEDEEESFVLFTRKSYENLVHRDIERKQREKEKAKPKEGRLVDGELVYDDDDDDDAKERDPSLVEGNTLPSQYECPKKYYGKALEDLDKAIKDKSFIVISPRFGKKYIHRYSANKAWFCLAPWNPLRRLAILVGSNQFFEYFVIITILVNMVFLALTTPIDVSEYVFLVIYTAEALVKLLSRGFILDGYTYLRDPWNWLDFFVILLGYFTMILEFSGSGEVFGGNLQGLRTFRVLRPLKTVSIIPGLKLIVNALIKSMRMLLEVMILTLFCMAVFALFAIQVYVGVLRQKCVLDLPSNWHDLSNNSDVYYLDWTKDTSHWLEDEDQYFICGNISGSAQCPAGYTCLPDIGSNPNYGYTSFDHFGWAMLTCFQLVTLDFWEDVYNKVISANGPWNIIFFWFVVFFGAFYLVNLMLAVVTMSYEEEATNAGKEKEREQAAKDAQKKKKTRYDLKNLKAKLDKDDTKGDKLKKSKKSKSKSTESAKNSQKNSSEKTDEDGRLKSAGSSSNQSDDAVRQGADSGMGSSEKMTTSDMMMTQDSNETSIEIMSSPTKGQSQLSTSGVEVDTDSTKGEDNPAYLRENDTIERIKTDTGEVIVIVKDGSGKELRDRNCSCCTKCKCDYITWLKFQNFLHMIVSDVFFDLFIMLMILTNTIVLATEQYNMTDAHKQLLKISNYVFTGVFTVECVLKLFALSRDYFRSGWNIFDFVIVIMSLVDVAVEDLPAISGLRVFRLARVVKLAQSWPTMRMLVQIVINTLSALGNMSFILIIILYIFAVVGMNLFQGTYTHAVFGPLDEDIPRWHFDDFFHSFFMVFRILCGEWIEPLWDCMRANGTICMAVFIPTLIIGNFMLLNLFLALLLNSFATSSPADEKPKEKSKFAIAWERIKHWFSCCTCGRGRAVSPSVKDQRDREEKKEKNSLAFTSDSQNESSIKSDCQIIEMEPIQSNGTSHSSSENIEERNNQINTDKLLSPNNVNGILKNKPEVKDPFKTSRDQYVSFEGELEQQKKEAEKKKKKGQELTLADIKPKSARPGKRTPISAADRAKFSAPNSDGNKYAKEGDNASIATEDEDEAAPKVHDCCPGICYRKIDCLGNMDNTGFGKKWYQFRLFMAHVVAHKIFETTVLLLIFCSSIALCFEDAYINEPEWADLKLALFYLNIIFSVLFTLEMLMKWVGLGFKKYFTNPWSILDFCIVVVSITGILLEALGLSQISGFRALRTLRALRPLRAVSRWQGMRIVVNALMYAIPSIFSVLVVCLLIWVIFSIMGVQFFKGLFRYCAQDGERLHYNITANKTECLAKGYEWINADIHFDGVGHGLLALFQVATFEGWMEVMRDAIDVTDIDIQPRRENSLYYYFFFFGFILVGSFFTLNLFIGVIIDNFNMLKKKYEGSYLDMFLTSNQRNYINTLKKLGQRKPQKTIKRPKGKLRAFFFDVALSNKFELAIVSLIMLNMGAMAIEHYKQSDTVVKALDITNLVFTTVFALEAIVKIIGMGWHYFRRVWNVFDFIVVFLSIIGVILDDLLTSIFITPTLLRVVRVFRIGRVLRLVKAAKGIRKLLFALVISLPALFNIALLLFMMMFIYSVVFMTSFSHVKHTGALNDQVNFETFVNSFVLLFRLTTSAGWNDVLYALQIKEPNCDPNFYTKKDGTKVAFDGGDCPVEWLAILLMVTYIFVNFLIIINMYIAVILENFNQAHEQEEVGITEDDFEMFYVIWERYDPHATQFIKLDHLSDFVADLDEPLGIAKPNEIAIVAFDLPIVEGEKLHCLDILTSLVKRVLGEVEDSEELKELKQQIDQKYRDSFPTRVATVVKSTTMRRKKEDVAAKTLQRAWRRHKIQKNMRQLHDAAVKNLELSRSNTKIDLGRRLSNAMGSSYALRPISATSRTSGTSLASAHNKNKSTTSIGGNTLKVPTSQEDAPV